MRRLLVAGLFACAAQPASVGPEAPESIGAVVVGSVDPGPLRPLEVHQAIGAMKVDLRECYQRELDENPALDGAAKVEVVFDGDGRVLELRLVEDALDAADLLQCLRRAAARWQLPAHAEEQRRLLIPVRFELRVAPSPSSAAGGKGAIQLGEDLRRQHHRGPARVVLEVRDLGGLRDGRGAVAEQEGDGEGARRQPDLRAEA